MSESRKDVPKSELHKKHIAESMMHHTVSKETREKIAKSREGKYSGENHPMFGKHMKEESKIQMIESNIETWKNPELRKIVSESNSGENNASYIDGRFKNYPLYISIRSSPKMDSWRKDVFRRDLFTCRVTGKRGSIEAHHIKPLSELFQENNILTIEDAVKCDLIWDASNGITLNKELHKSLHSKYGTKIPEFELFAK